VVVRIVKGNKTTELTKEEYLNLCKNYLKVEMDLGTGDGRFVYEQATSYPDILFIGVDPSQKQLELYSKKAQRKRLANVLFVVGSIEVLPPEFNGTISKLHINFPWGTLLKSISAPKINEVIKLKSLLTPTGEMEIILGYSQEFEPGETQRLELPEITEEHIEKVIFPIFKQAGFNNIVFQALDKQSLVQIQTTWSKKLAFGKDRQVFKIQAKLT